MGWTRVKSLGRGGYGFVSLGRLTSCPDSFEAALKLPPEFAVKSAPFKDSESLVYERELFHELRGCPSIIRCYGADASQEDDVILYNLFLELAAGGSLAERIYHGKPMGEEEVKGYTRSILLGLRHMHDVGIVHCDIKPGNILLVEDGEDGYVAKIADLGLAILESRRDVENLIGTVPYLAPESVLRGDYGPAADIWALGCTVVEMLVGRRLRNFDGKLELNMETVERMAKQQVEIPCGISAEARHFLIRCLNPNPLLRWDADRLLMDTSFLAQELQAGLPEEVKEDYVPLGDYIPLGDGSDAESDVDESSRPMPLLKRGREAEDQLDSDHSDLYPAFCKKRRLDDSDQLHLHLVIK